jgi:hypothetical protein
MRRLFGGMLAAALVLGAVGCNHPSARSTPEKVRQEFKLTWNGQPVDAAALSFISSTNANIVPTGGTGKDGTCTTPLEPGTYTITITKSDQDNPMKSFAAGNDPKNRQKFKDLSSGRAKVGSLVPVQYTDTKTTPFKDIRVPSADGKPIELDMKGTAPASEPAGGDSKKADGAKKDKKS